MALTWTSSSSRRCVRCSDCRFRACPCSIASHVLSPRLSATSRSTGTCARTFPPLSLVFALAGIVCPRGRGAGACRQHRCHEYNASHPHCGYPTEDVNPGLGLTSGTADWGYAVDVSSPLQATCTESAAPLQRLPCSPHLCHGITEEGNCHKQATCDTVPCHMGRGAMMQDAPTAGRCSGRRRRRRGPGRRYAPADRRCPGWTPATPGQTPTARCSPLCAACTCTADHAGDVRRQKQAGSTAFPTA